MKINSLKIFIISIFLLIGATSFGQQYLISQGGTITTCEGTLYDSGGPNGNYLSSENYTITICSEDGNFLVLNFTQFEFESGTYDKLSIYDGPNTTSPALVTNAGGTTLLNQTFTSTGSCLTLHMQTDGSITRPGFAAVISCLPPCQDFEVNVVNTSIPFSQPLDSLWINVCLGETVTFTAAGTYPNNNVNYTQSDATTDWYWTLSSSGPPIEANGVGMTTFTHTFNESGGYFLGLVGKDANGCLVSYLEQIRVRVSIPPNLSVDPAVGGCIGDAIELSGYVTTNSWEIVIADEQIVQECITDDQGVVQSFCWNINAFQPGQTITSLNDLEHVCLNIEHSWVADVWIYIECPNGQRAEINYYSTSNPCSGEYFGSPNHSDNCVPGTGWDYCWTMNATQSHTAWCQGNSGSVPPGDYLPTGNFADLIGCPINGEWCVVIIDDWGSDDGTLFSVDIGFNQAVTPSYLWSYSHTYAPTGMSWSGNGLGANSGGTATAFPTESGTQIYDFCVTDDFGCSYCIPAIAEVLSIDDPSCCILPDTDAGPDDAVCTNTYTFNASIATGNTGTWTMISGPGTATWANQNSPHATVTVSEWGVYVFEWTEMYLSSPTCADSDIITVEFWPIPTTTFTYNPIMCNEDQTTITYVGNMSETATFNWDFDGATVVSGSGIGPYSIYWTEPGMHHVGLNISENGCSSPDTLVNILNPALLEHTLEVDDDPCYTSCRGRAEIFPTGGTVPYQYSWGSQGPVLSNLCTGEYGITVTDNNGCTSGQTFFIDQPTELVINDITYNHLTCYQTNDGNISVDASGGTGDLTYLWSDIGYGTANRTDIPAQDYCVTVTDANGCSVAECVTITQPAELLVTVSPDVAICEGSQTVLQASGMGGTVPYTYMWRYSQDSSFTVGPASYIVTPDTTRIYEVYVVDDHGCESNLASIKVTVSPKMIIDTMLIQHNRCYESCDGRAEIVMQGGLAPLHYSWGSDNHIYSGLCAGLYTVTISDLIGCSVSNHFIIEQPNPITYSTSTKPATCYGYDDGEATILIQGGGTTPYTYLWPNGHNTETLTTTAGTYTVTVVDDHGCRILSSFEITQPSKIIVLPMSNARICKTQSITLSNQATGGTPYYDFRWEGSDGSVWNSNLYTVSPETTTTYTLVVTDSQGCKSSPVSTTVYVNPDLKINSIITSNDTVCPGDPAIVHVDVEGGNGGPYLMTLQDGSVVPSPFTVYPDTTTMYYITLADMCGTPTVIDSILIHARPKPGNLFTVEKVSGCPPFAAHFTESTPNFGQTYLWNFGDKKYSTEKNPIHIYKEPGVYTVSLEVRDFFGCKFKREIEDLITVYQGPTANFEASPKIVSFINAEIEFINYSSDASNYYWFFGDGDSSLFVSPRHKYKDIGDFEVMLVAETDRSCTDTTVRIVSVRNEFSFYMPTSFTPNGDGLNDCARPCGNGIDKNDFYLKIYDRWGIIIFETDKFDPKVGCESCSEGAWDGTFKGNKNKGDKTLANGVYYWYAEFKDWYGVVHKKQGEILLVK